MSLDPNVDEVCQAMQDRSWVGYRKYGVTTTRSDLSTHQWLTHLQEELMDAAIYIQRLKKEVALAELVKTNQEIGLYDLQSYTAQWKFSWEQEDSTVSHLPVNAAVDALLPSGCHWGLGACYAPTFDPSLHAGD